MSKSFLSFEEFCCPGTMKVILKQCFGLPPPSNHRHHQCLQCSHLVAEGVPNQHMMFFAANNNEPKNNIYIWSFLMEPNVSAARLWQFMTSSATVGSRAGLPSVYPSAIQVKRCHSRWVLKMTTKPTWPVEFGLWRSLRSSEISWNCK